VLEELYPSRAWIIVNSMMPSKPNGQPEARKGHDATSDRPNVSLTFVGSMVAMMPWPMLAFGLCMMGSIFEQPNEFILLLGGVTMLLMLPIGLLDPPEWVMVVTICSVWIIVLALPVLLAAKQRLSKSQLVVALVLQTVFSMAQSGLGLLMLAGRNV
jgi:hypothetical protein